MEIQKNCQLSSGSKPFSAITFLPPVVKTSHRATVIEASRTKFGRPRAEVEREILDLLFTFTHDRFC